MENRKTVFRQTSTSIYEKERPSSLSVKKLSKYPYDNWKIYTMTVTQYNLTLWKRLSTLRMSLCEVCINVKYIPGNLNYNYFKNQYYSIKREKNI